MIAAPDARYKPCFFSESIGLTVKERDDLITDATTTHEPTNNRKLASSPFCSGVLFMDSNSARVPLPNVEGAILSMQDVDVEFSSGKADL